MPGYGLADATADLYEGKQKGDVDRVKMDSMRNQLFNEGFKRSMTLLATGRVKESQDFWNKTGKHRIKDLAVDDKGIATWTSLDSGEQHTQSVKELATIAGVSLPADVAGKRKHELNLAHVRAGGSGSTAMGKNITRIAKILGGDEKKALQWLQKAKADPQKAYMEAVKTVQMMYPYAEAAEKERRIEELLKAARAYDENLYGMNEGEGDGAPPPDAQRGLNIGGQKPPGPGLAPPVGGPGTPGFPGFGSQPAPAGAPGAQNLPEHMIGKLGTGALFTDKSSGKTYRMISESQYIEVE